jgi:branched-subunit amino acid transport protein
MILVALAVLAAGTYVMKSVGPMAAAGRRLPDRLQALAELVPAALLAALVANQTVVDGAGMTLDARVAGVAVAAVAVALRAPFGLVVLLGAGATALLRAAGVG